MDAVVIYAYLFWPLLTLIHLTFNIDATKLILILPLWGRILTGVVSALPATLIPVTLWIYSMGKSDELATEKERNLIYYTGAWLGDVTGFLYYWRYIRTGKDLEFCPQLNRILNIERGR